MCLVPVISILTKLKVDQTIAVDSRNLMLHAGCCVRFSRFVFCFESPSLEPQVLVSARQAPTAARNAHDLHQPHALASSRMCTQSGRQPYACNKLPTTVLSTIIDLCLMAQQA